MESLLFSLNATVPVFLMMVLGAAVRRLGLLDVETARKLNRFVFRLALPVLLFNDMSGTDISQVWDGRFVLFCVGANAVSIAVAWVLALPWKDKSIRGEFVQASYRSSAALLGTAILTNLYGSVGMAPLMMAITVPAYNIVAVVALNVFRPDGKTGEKGRLGKTLRGIVTNPLIIGILLGLVWSALKVPMPAILGKTLSSLGSLATPLGLMAMGATFDLKSALSQSKHAAGGGGHGISGAGAGGDPGDAGLRHVGQFLCHGGQHGPRGGAHLRGGHAHHPAERLHLHRVAVAAAGHGAGVSGALIFPGRNGNITIRVKHW